MIQLLIANDMLGVICWKNASKIISDFVLSALVENYGNSAMESAGVLAAGIRFKISPAGG